MMGHVHAVDRERNHVTVEVHRASLRDESLPSVGDVVGMVVHAESSDLSKHSDLSLACELCIALDVHDHRVMVKEEPGSALIDTVKRFRAEIIRRAGL